MSSQYDPQAVKLERRREKKKEQKKKILASVNESNWDVIACMLVRGIHSVNA